MCALFNMCYGGILGKSKDAIVFYFCFLTLLSRCVIAMWICIFILTPFDILKPQDSVIMCEAVMIGIATAS